MVSSITAATAAASLTPSPGLGWTATCIAPGTDWWSWVCSLKAAGACPESGMDTTSGAGADDAGAIST